MKGFLHYRIILIQVIVLYSGTKTDLIICWFLPDVNVRPYYITVQFLHKCDKPILKEHS